MHSKSKLGIITEYPALDLETAKMGNIVPTAASQILERTRPESVLGGGLNRSYMSEVERGRSDVSLSTLQKIARPLGISLADLFTTFRPLPDGGSPANYFRLNVPPSDLATIRPGELRRSRCGKAKGGPTLTLLTPGVQAAGV